VEVDHRGDVYALGVMFYRLMAGRLPFDVGGLPLLDAAQRILYSDVAPLGSIDSSCVGPIEQVAARAMARDPGRRYQSAAALAADLRACLEGRFPSATPSVAEAEPPGAPLILAESADRRFVAISLVGGGVVVLDSATGAQLAVIRGDGTPVGHLTFEADGRLVIGRSGGRVEYIAVLAPS
jgi:serine/threonine protein kinase